MKQFTNFRIFTKVVRKYWKKYARRHVDLIGGKKFVSYWTDKEWCYFLVDKFDQLDDDKIVQRFLYDISYDNFLKHRPLWKSLLGKRIYLTRKIGDTTFKDEGTFSGFIITNNGAWLYCTDFIAFDGKKTDGEMLPLCLYELEEKIKN